MHHSRDKAAPINLSDSVRLQLISKIYEAPYEAALLLLLEMKCAKVWKGLSRNALSDVATSVGELIDPLAIFSASPNAREHSFTLFKVKLQNDQADAIISLPEN